MGDKPPKPTGTDAASGTGSRLRFLVESETETDSTEQTVVGDDGADSVEKVVDPADASISFADTTGDDFKASDEAYNSDGVLVDSDGKTMIASEESTEASAVILTLGFSVLAFFAF